MVLRSIGRLLGSGGFAVQPFNKGADFIAYVAAHDVRLVVARPLDEGNDRLGSSGAALRDIAED